MNISSFLQTKVQMLIWAGVITIGGLLLLLLNLQKQEQQRLIERDRIEQAKKDQAQRAQDQTALKKLKDAAKGPTGDGGLF